MAENKKFSNQFTSRLNPEREARLNAIHAQLTASGTKCETGTEMLDALLALAENGGGGGQLPAHMIAVNAAEFQDYKAAAGQLRMILDKCETSDINAVLLCIDGSAEYATENEKLNQRIRDLVSENGKFAGAEILSRDNPKLALAYAILDNRVKSGKSDGTMLQLVNSVFKLLLLPQFNNMIDKSEGFSAELYTEITAKKG